MPDNNVKQAYAMFRGQKVLASYDETSDSWSVEINAPAESSWSQPDHVFLVELFAEDLAGNVASLDSTDPVYGDQLKIRVLEKTPPTATIVYPTQSSVLGKSEQDIKLRITDAGGSDINIESIEFKLNGSKILGAKWEEENGEYNCTYHAVGLPDGINTITLQATDNDGNVSEIDTVSFIISTSAPSLNIIAPIEGLLTNVKEVILIGTSSPGSSYTTISTVTVSVNSGPEESISFTGGSAEVSFEKAITLVDGSNTITIKATDSSGNSVSVVRTVMVDTVAPLITDVRAESLVVDSDGLIKITFKVVES